MKSTLIKPKRLPEGCRYFGAGYQFNRLSLIEILQYILGYLRTKKLTPDERDIEKRVGDALLIVGGEEGDFVFIEPDEWEILGIGYYMKYIYNIQRKLGGRMKMVYSVK